MPPAIGFILLTHNKPDQVIRLIATLNRMFDNPPIVCHHDFSKSEFPVDMLTKNVSLVSPHLQTGWAKFSVVEATLRAFELMYGNVNSPDWSILLSGADYPIKSSKQILHDLASSSYDVHMHHEQINYNVYGRDRASSNVLMGNLAWQKLCYERYCFARIWITRLDRKLHLTKRQVILKHPLLTALFLPFSKNLRCFAGEHWFCANRKAAKYLIEFHRTKPALASHYRKLDYCTISPDESYYQTIFCNAPHLKVSQNNWRYIDWSGKGWHPKTLLLEDISEIHASSAHFARKFDIDEDVRILDELDAVVG
jgi:Core-2/I-Branching enzyme